MSGGAWPVVRVVEAPEGATLIFLADGVVVEDDTYNVLGAEPVAKETREAPGRLLAEAANHLPRAPGTVVVQEGTPVRLLAIVHDLDREPTWRLEWVAGALSEVLRLAEEREMRSLALPVLGSVHGSLEATRFVELLGAAFEGSSPEHLEEIWLIVAPDLASSVRDGLRRSGFEVGNRPG